MDKEIMKEKVNEIKEIVADLDEPMKTEAFKMLLKRELDGEITPTKQTPSILEPAQQSMSATGQSDPIGSLAMLCEISKEKIKDVVEYANDNFILMKRVDGSNDVQKQLNASQIFLTARYKGIGEEFTMSTALSKAIKDRGINADNLGRNLATKPDVFKIIHGHGKGAKYGLTTEGWQKGLELIKSLAGS